MAESERVADVRNSADVPRSTVLGWVLAGCYAVLPFIVAFVATSRLTPGDCCWGRGFPVALTMVFWSMVGSLVFLWPASVRIRSGDGGKLTRGHFWVLVGTTVAVLVFAPLFVGNLLEGNL